MITFFYVEPNGGYLTHCTPLFFINSWRMIIYGLEVPTNSTKIWPPQNLMIPQYCCRENFWSYLFLLTSNSQIFSQQFSIARHLILLVIQYCKCRKYTIINQICVKKFILYIIIIDKLWIVFICHEFSDLYDAYLAPILQESLFVETWQNGPDSDTLPSNCSIKFQVLDIHVEELHVALSTNTLYGSDSMVLVDSCRLLTLVELIFVLHDRNENEFSII